MTRAYSVQSLMSAARTSSAVSTCPVAVAVAVAVAASDVEGGAAASVRLVSNAPVMPPPSPAVRIAAASPIRAYVLPLDGRGGGAVGGGFQGGCPCGWYTPGLGWVMAAEFSCRR